MYVCYPLNRKQYLRRAMSSKGKGCYVIDVTRRFSQWFPAQFTLLHINIPEDWQSLGSPEYLILGLLGKLKSYCASKSV